MNLTVQLRGIDQISLRTKALFRAAQTGMKFGVQEAAQIFEDEAKTIVPVDTGHLRDSIHQELIESTDTRAVIAVTPVYEEPNPWGIEPPYARRIEFGFTGTDAPGRHYHQSPQPYMRPAFDTKQDEARQAIKDSIYQELEVVRH